MKNEIGKRLESLHSEYEAGQKMLSELDTRRSTLVNTMLRIEGAIQVLKELAEPAPNGNATAPALASPPSPRPD